MSFRNQFLITLGISKNMLEKIFACYKENAQLIIVIFGIKLKFKTPTINQLEEVCNIQNLIKLKKQNTYFPHPIGIVIHPKVILGKNCTIFQNVTIGQGKNINGRDIPIIGDNVTVYANAVIIGGITIGNNVTIGAGSIVISDIPDNAVVAGNPSRIIKLKI